jgi:hypothetical protein
MQKHKRRPAVDGGDRPGLADFGKPIEQFVIAQSLPRRRYRRHAQSRWPQILRILSDNDYRGFLSVELEDEEFNGTPECEMAGLIASRDFLTGV